MENLAAVRVVAFSRKNHAIHIHPDDWKVDIYGKKVVMKGGRSKVRYDLSTDLQCIYVMERIEKTAVGKTVKRAALTGLAASMLSQGKGIGGAMMDFALRGSEIRVIVHARMVMKDTTTLAFEATEEEYEKFASTLPSRVQTRAAIDQARKMISVADRMAADGVRAVAEIDTGIASLQEQQIHARQLIDKGVSFDERDAARQEELNIRNEIEFQRQLKKAAMHRLSAPPFLNRRISLSRMSVVIVMVTFGGILVIGAFSDDNQDQESDAAPSVATTTTPPVPATTDVAKDDSKPAPEQNGTNVAMVAMAPPVPQPTSARNDQVTVNATSSENDTHAPAMRSAPSTGPSFDCSKASSHVEKMICSDPRLSTADEKLAETYRDALAASADKGTLRADQIRWIKTERNVCTDATSLFDVYEAREKHLQRMVVRQ